MHPPQLRVHARDLVSRGLSLSAVSRSTGVARSTLRAWMAPGAVVASGCPRCDDDDVEGAPYAALLGYYLGDGYIATFRRGTSLRISCDTAYGGIIEDLECVLRDLVPGRRTFRVSAPGVTVVQSNWKHWPCLFPQHGPGRKHERPIVLEDWQARIVEAHPADFLRGLFHSDGSRVANWTQRVVAGRPKRYDYPRWQFTNVSADIRELCCWALDLVDVPWRQSNHKTISVSTRSGVARLDALIGLKD
jgi:hypothetical protein